MAASDILSLLLGTNANSIPQQVVDANQEVMAQMYDSVAPFSLGTHTTQENKKRTRKEILTKWEQMLKFAPVAEGIGIHVMAALGGDTHTGQQIFITPTERLRGELGKTEKAQLEKLQKGSKKLVEVIIGNLYKKNKYWTI